MEEENDLILEEEKSKTDTLVPTMPKWGNPPKIEDLKGDFIDAQSDHNFHVAEVAEWLDALNCEGKFAPKSKKGRSKVAPKLVKKQAEWRIPSLSEPFLSTDDLYTASPVSAEDKKAAQQNALILNNQFSTKLNKVNFIDRAVRTFVQEGTIIVRTGWISEEIEVDKEVRIYEYELDESEAGLQFQQDLMALKEESPSVYNDLPAHVKESHELTLLAGKVYKAVPTDEIQTIKEVKVLKNQPTLEVCDYRNVLLDPTCKGDLDKANFVIYSFETNKSDLKKSGLYFNIDNIAVEDNSILAAPDHSMGETSSFNFKDDARKKFVAYEYWGYWDIDNSGMTKPIVATWVGDTIIRMEESPYPHGKLPFDKAEVIPVTKGVYGEPDAALISDNQQIVGALTRGMIDLMGRSANAQVGSDKMALDVTNRRKFQAGEDYEYNPGSDPTKAFYMHKYPEIPQSALVLLDQQNSDAESLTGVKAFSSGLSGNALGDTATGIRSALDAASKRELSIMRRFADMMVKVGHKIIAMNQQFLSEEEVIRVTDEKFVAVRRDDLAGNFDLRLTISTAESDNHKAEQLAFMLQTNGNNMDPNLSKIIWADIARLRNMPTLAKQIESFEPQPDPLRQQLQQMEIAKLQAEINEINARTQEHLANAQLDMAKARQTSSDADLKDLDYVEQESGVKQERELEKAGRQAEGNIALETHKALLANRTQ